MTLSDTLRLPPTEGQVLRMLGDVGTEVFHGPDLSDDVRRPARVAYGLIRPGSGVALIDRAPDSFSGAVSLFRARLRRLCGGDPAADAIPVVYLSLTDDEFQRLTDVLDCAFDAHSPLDATNTLWTVVARQAFTQDRPPVLPPTRPDAAPPRAVPAPVRPPEQAPAVQFAPGPIESRPRGISGGLVAVLCVVSLLALASGGLVVWMFLDPLGARVAGRPAAVENPGRQARSATNGTQAPEVGKGLAATWAKPAPVEDRPSPATTVVPPEPARPEPLRAAEAPLVAAPAPIPAPPALVAAPMPVPAPVPAPIPAVPAPTATLPSVDTGPAPPRPAGPLSPPVVVGEARPPRPVANDPPAPAPADVVPIPERRASPAPEPVVAQQAGLGISREVPPRTAPAAPDLPAELLAALVRRGDAMLGANDVSAARLLYERAAAAGSAEAARAMGRTFDPAVLAGLGLRPSLADPIAAASWYGRATALGDPEAPALTRRLTAGAAR